MSVGVLLALVACVLALTGLGLVSLLLVKLDARRCLRQIKVDARIGRWFGLAIQVDREAEHGTTPPTTGPGEPRAPQRAVRLARSAADRAPESPAAGT